MTNEATEKIIKNEDIELELLLEAIYMKYGYDFRNYSRAHIRRRIRHKMTLGGFRSITEILHKTLYDSKFFYELLSYLSISTTKMFRDPSFYKAFREKVIPILKTYPFIRIWHAGCSTGQEVYSMAILLEEEGLLHRTQIYATDFDKAALKEAKEGIYHIDNIKEYTHNYQKSGGKSSFSDYYVAQYGSVIFDSSLNKKITFAEHNLVTDGLFGEMHVILCRNVLIYFNNELQNKVIKLFLDSLCDGCFLCLGSSESLISSNSSNCFEEFAITEKVYRKKYIV
jgi:chemotaxis protein methyltransferase CheR